MPTARHNHHTRDIKEPGKCVACDRYNYNHLNCNKNIAMGQLRQMYILLNEAYEELLGNPALDGLYIRYTREGWPDLNEALSSNQSPLHPVKPLT